MSDQEEAFVLDEGVIGWIHKTARKNFWRVAPHIDYDDLVHDGYLDFYRCKDIYKDTVKDRAHAMALVKTTFLNRITDLANARTRANEICASQILTLKSEDGETDFWETIVGEGSELASMSELIKRAPWEVAQVFSLFLSDLGLSKLREPYMKNNGIRESTNEKWCRILGMDASEHDLVKEVREFLST